jgi:hypothetical protein
MDPREDVFPSMDPIESGPSRSDALTGPVNRAGDRRLCGCASGGWSPLFPSSFIHLCPVPMCGEAKLSSFLTAAALLLPAPARAQRLRGPVVVEGDGPPGWIR